MTIAQWLGSRRNMLVRPFDRWRLLSLKGAPRQGVPLGVAQPGTQRAAAAAHLLHPGRVPGGSE